MFTSQIPALKKRLVDSILVQTRAGINASILTWDQNNISITHVMTEQDGNAESINLTYRWMRLFLFTQYFYSQ